VTTIPGDDDNNSDILLLQLPADVGRLTIQTTGPSASDTIDVVESIPELSALGLVLIGAPNFFCCARLRAFLRIC
jgi:hypothetical protein